MYLLTILSLVIPSLVIAQDIRSCVESPVDMVMLLDSSGSIKSDNFKKIKQFVSDFVKEFDIGNRTRVAITTYGLGIYKSETTELDTHKTRAEILDAVSKIQYHSGTDTQTWIALNYMRTVQFKAGKVRTTAKRIGIVITDGRSQKPKLTKQEADLARSEGIQLFAIGIGDADVTELKAIGGGAAGMELVSSASGLQRVKNSVLKKTCTILEAVTIPPTTPIPTVCFDTIDMTLLLDASASVRKDDFQKIKDFVTNFINQFDIGPGNNSVRVAACTFGLGVYKKSCIQLDTYSTKQQLIDALGKMKHQFGIQTDTSDALEYMRTVQMSSKVVRKNARKVCIVITDGNSQRWQVTWGAAQLARQENIATFAIGIGPEEEIKTVELKRIAGVDERVFRVSNAGALHSIKDSLERLVCDKRRT